MHVYVRVVTQICAHIQDTSACVPVHGASEYGQSWSMTRDQSLANRHFLSESGWIGNSDLYRDVNDLGPRPPPSPRLLMSGRREGQENGERNKSGCLGYCRYGYQMLYYCRESLPFKAPSPPYFTTCCVSHVSMSPVCLVQGRPHPLPRDPSHTPGTPARPLTARRHTTRPKTIRDAEAHGH